MIALTRFHVFAQRCKAKAFAAPHLVGGRGAAVRTFKHLTPHQIEATHRQREVMHKQEEKDRIEQTEKYLAEREIAKLREDLSATENNQKQQQQQQQPQQRPHRLPPWQSNTQNRKPTKEVLESRLKYLEAQLSKLTEQQKEEALVNPVPLFAELFVDRSALKAPQSLDYAKAEGLSAKLRPPSRFELKLLHSIQARGPLTFAQYMRECLTNPADGYYSKDGEIFGTKGDFVTAPEVTQMFGEMVGIWCAYLWELLGKPPKLNLVEFGPGKGTLMANFLRATSGFKDFQAALCIHFVEASSRLQEVQRQKLAEFSKIPMSWHGDLVTIPNDAPVIAVAQEFFDALPVNVYRYGQYREEDKWREMLVDWDEKGAGYLRLVTCKTDTMTNAVSERLIPEFGMPGQTYYVPLEGVRVVQEMGARIAKFGGGMLVIDYGQYGQRKGENIVAIRQHKAEGIFDNPGQADLSCWVDFRILAKALRNTDFFGKLDVHGPMPQGEFLRASGIDFRLIELLKKLDDDDPRAESLISGYERVVGTNEDQMGATYKAWSFTSKGIVPAGFEKASTRRDDDDI